MSSVAFLCLLGPSNHKIKVITNAKIATNNAVAILETLLQSHMITFYFLNLLEMNRRVPHQQKYEVMDVKQNRLW